jgi:hypothetical protein
MAKKNDRTNPFYVLLVIFGVIFCITASAYGIMALKSFSPGTQANTDSGLQLLKFLDQYGLYLMLAELALLGVCTFAAMATDSYWSSQPTESHDNTSPPQ